MPPPLTTVASGNGLVARAGRPFTARLAVRVTDGSRPAPGAVVSFRVLSGAAAFAGGAAVATASTDATGVARSPVLDAGSESGPVRVTALAAGGVLPASFTLRVTAD